MPPGRLVCLAWFLVRRMRFHLCYWSFRMAQLLNGSVAGAVGEIHEDCEEPQDPFDPSMDMINNAVEMFLGMSGLKGTRQLSGKRTQRHDDPTGSVLSLASEGRMGLRAVTFSDGNAELLDGRFSRRRQARTAVAEMAVGVASSGLGMPRSGRGW
jgi:hypothetical protein